jgi:UDP-N-acetylglucosamine acyltransferase
MIHPAAIVHPGAKLGPDVVVGPFAVIDEHVALGARCRVGAHVHLTGHTTIGDDNRFHTGAVIGDAPQDFKYAGTPTRLRIGNGNTFREHVTVNRSNKLEEDTVLGDSNFLMAGSHVGHNCVIGNQNILANGALLAGHVVLADRAFVSGNCLVHQFCRIGRLGLMQGGSAISKDLPPFCVARGDNGICGLNVIGLRRAGVNADQRLRLKRAYAVLFRSSLRREIALARTESEFAGDPLVTELIDFIRASRRGICADTRGPSRSDSSDDESGE